jgi:hypothetical protein
VSALPQNEVPSRDSLSVDFVMDKAIQIFSDFLVPLTFIPPPPVFSSVLERTKHRR